MILGLILCACLAGVLAYQLASGNALNRSWSVRATRKENPGKYWSLIIFQLIAVLIVLCVLIRRYIAGAVR